MKRTVEAYVQLFNFEDQRWLPLFKMELTFDDEKMDFYPSFRDLEDAILFIVTLIAQTLQVNLDFSYFLTIMSKWQNTKSL